MGMASSDMLENSDYGEGEYIQHITEEFDKKTKCIFRNDARPSFIKVGHRTINDHANNIVNGQLKVTG